MRQLIGNQGKGRKPWVHEVLAAATEAVEGDEDSSSAPESIGNLALQRQKMCADKASAFEQIGIALDMYLDHPSADKEERLRQVRSIQVVVCIDGLFSEKARKTFMAMLYSHADDPLRWEVETEFAHRCAPAVEFRPQGRANDLHFLERGEAHEQGILEDPGAEFDATDDSVHVVLRPHDAGMTRR